MQHMALLSSFHCTLFIYLKHDAHDIRLIDTVGERDKFHNELLLKITKPNPDQTQPKTFI